MIDKKVLLSKLNYSFVKECILNKGYAFFTGEMNVNLVGFRCTNKYTNAWEDVLVVAYQTKGEDRIAVFEDFTTVPGTFYAIKKLLNPKGVAVMKSDQYRGFYKLGKHRGKYHALVQRVPASIGRDGDLDYDIDFTDSTYGMFGINLHHGNDSKWIWKYSAGCQVLRYKDQLEHLLHEYVCPSIAIYGNSITYTLFDEI